MRHKLLAVLFGTTLILAACGGEDAGENAGSSSEQTTASSEEERLYQNKCSSCHGGNLTGGVGPDLTAVGSNMSEGDILKVINEGKGGMPGGLLEGEDAESVAAWLSGKK